jgi:hypothetical protein
MRRFLAALVLAVTFAPNDARTAEVVDLELVLLADASRSIDDAEIRFQPGHYAAALTHPEILAAIANGYRQRIAVAYVEWGDEESQDIVVPWTFIDGPAAGGRFAEALKTAPRRAFGMNAIGSAIAAAHALIVGNPIRSDRQVIDFSGDSANKFGGGPIAEARSAALADGIVINGLAILCHTCESGRPVEYDLEAAFKATIIGGRRSFVVTADGADQFAIAVRRKLLLEIAEAGSAAIVTRSP